MSLRCLALVFILLSTTFTRGQESVVKANSGVLVQLLAEHFPESLGKVFLEFEKEKSDPFELPTNRLSDPVKAAARVMVLKTTNKEVPVCTIKLPETGKAFVVVLVTARPSGFSPIVVRSDDPDFKAGDVLFINRSAKTILCKLGGNQITLKPDESKKDRPTNPVDNTYFDIAFAARDAAGDKLISSSRWPIDNHLRSYLFFFTNAQGKTTFRAVDEYLDSVKP